MAWLVNGSLVKSLQNEDQITCFIAIWSDVLILLSVVYFQIGLTWAFAQGGRI